MRFLEIFVLKHDVIIVLVVSRREMTGTSESVPRRKRLHALNG